MSTAAFRGLVRGNRVEEAPVRRYLSVVAMVGLVAPAALVAPAVVAAPALSVVIVIDDGVIEARTSGASTATTRIELAVFDYGGDADWGPSASGTATGQSCTIAAPASPSSEWDGACTIPGAAAMRWLGVTAIPYTSSGAGSTVDSNQVIWAGPSESSDTSGPPDLLQAVGRSSSDDCAAVADAALGWGTGLVGGWQPSWAEWANGPVCVRTFTYTAQGWRLR